MYFEDVLPALRNGAKVRRKAWIENMYIYFNGDVLYDQKDRTIACCDYYLNCTDWEIYKEDIDWEYVKNNKCLCYFWDYADTEYILGYLYKYDVNVDKPFFWKDENNGTMTYYDNCRPVKINELNFYENKDNEENKRLIEESIG